MNDLHSVPHTEHPSKIAKIFRGYYFFTLIASLIGAAAQMILLLSEYEVEIGMYRHGSVLAAVFTGFVLLTTAAILSMPLVIKRLTVGDGVPELHALPEDDTPVVFASTLSGFILVAVLILQIVIGTPFPGFRVITDYFWASVLILAIPAVCFFFLPILPVQRKAQAQKALGFFPVIWCIAYLMNIYFDNSTALGSPVRILTELAVIASMLFFLTELRARIGKYNSVVLLTFINISIFYSGLCAIPMISVAFINQWELKADILYSAVQLCFLTYFVARANTLVRR